MGILVETVASHLSILNAVVCHNLIFTTSKEASNYFNSSVICTTNDLDSFIPTASLFEVRAHIPFDLCECKRWHVPVCL